MSKLVHTNKSEHFLGKIVMDEETGKKRITHNSERYLQHFLNTKTKVGEKVSITITTQQLKRTLRQNRYYWANLQHISDQGSNDPEDLHNLFKGLFLSKGVVNVLGHRVRRTKSTTDLSVTGFAEYMEKIAELTGIELLPIENWELAPLRK